MLPSSRTSLPETGVAEFINSVHNLRMTIHWADAGGTGRYEAVFYGPADFPAAYHAFAVGWESDAVTWYVDGVQRWQVTDVSHLPNVPMEILIDPEAGFPTPPPASVYSARMLVDRVRVWQH